MSFVAELRQVLRRQDFRKLFAVRLVSQGGDGAFQVGLASVFLFSPERQPTAAAAAGAFAASLLPYTVVGPFAGVLLDRRRRRQVLAGGNMLRAGLGSLVAVLVLTHRVGLPLYLVVLVALSANRFLLAGLGASLPHVVPRAELVMANAVSPTSGTVFFLLGGAAGYGMRRLLGPGDRPDSAVVLLAALAWFAAGLLARRMQPDLLGPTHPLAIGEAGGPGQPTLASALRAEARGVVRGLVSAARHVHQRRPVQYVLSAVGLHRFGFGVSLIAVILLCRNYFAPGDTNRALSLLAVTVGVSGVGFGLAAFVTPGMVARLGTRGWIVTCFAVAALANLALLIALTPVTMAASAFVVGLTAQGAKICVDSVVQREVDDEFRGRVFSFYDMVFNAAFVAAAVAAALLLPADGHSLPVIAGVAAVYAFTGFWYARVSGLFGRGMS